MPATVAMDAKAASFHGSRFTAVKPAANAHECGKCGGTGFYCNGVVNGNPTSNTGFDCYSCHGTGWIIPKPRPKTCPVCGLKWLDIHEPHTFNSVYDGADHIITCPGPKKA